MKDQHKNARYRIPVEAGVESDVTTSVNRAISEARSAQRAWIRLPIRHRLARIRELRHLIAENAIGLAEASAAARNRPATESLAAEVLPLANACRFLEKQAEKILASKTVDHSAMRFLQRGVRGRISREPLGVVLVIGPGNYPLLLPGVQVIQALAAGNAVLLKPGAGGGEVARVLSELLARAGFDNRLLAVLPETVDAGRAALAARPDKVLFTGSAATGEKILAQLAKGVVPATMELSGCDAVIICEDADLQLAAKSLVFGLTFNNGATCMAPKRAFVSRAVATEIEGRLDQLLREHPGRSPESTCNEKLRVLLEDALSRGAHFIAGELPRNGAPTGPIVLAGVCPSSAILREDIFAPVLAIVTVANDREAVLLANDCPFALGASIFSRDEARAQTLAGLVDVGVVCINDVIVPTADARIPFGGRRQSGFGVTRGAEGLLELTVPKVITVTRGTFRPAFNTPQAGDDQVLNAFTTLKHGRGIRARWRALLSIINIFRARHKTSSNNIS
jgi:acyl-CoA reductase-like NAD-dependent aldehyde dehydrogenase